ncbi:MAG: hypothetical protein ACOYBH_00280 [Candidatus Alectryocaccobium sp.]|jgi:hypothetical protein
MKKRIYRLLIILSIGLLVACGTKKYNEADDPTADEDFQAIISESVQGTAGVDLDLSELSSSMAYAQIYNMKYTPDDYIGKTVKIRGQFAYYENAYTKVRYFACIITDGTGCCSQELEFIPAGEHACPDDYPMTGSEITVTGTCEAYEKNGYRYCRLVNATVEL